MPTRGAKSATRIRRPTPCSACVPRRRARCARAAERALDRTERTERDGGRAMIDMVQRTHAVNDATYAAWNAHDAEAVAAVFADDAVLIEAGSPSVLRGRSAIRERATALLTAFPDF